MTEAKATTSKTATTEVVKNCPACKKVLKRAKRYYRNGKYFCNKNCFKKFVQSQSTPAEGQQKSS